MTNDITPWTAAQIAFQQWLATPRPEREPATREALAEELGIHVSTLWRWAQQPGFLEEVNELARSMLKSSLPEIYGALIAQAKAGSYQHIELVMKMTCEYNPKATLNVDPSDRMSELLQRALAPWSQEGGGQAAENL